MTAGPRKTRSRIDADGVKVVEVARRAQKRLADRARAAARLGGGPARAAARAARGRAPRCAEPAAEPRRAPAAVAAAGARRPRRAPLAEPRAHTVRRRDAPPPAPPPPAQHRGAARGLLRCPNSPTMPSASERRGSRLFPPLGTDPPKIGIVVPEDFELPEGYVRHYQATDDGEPLPAILMFHPDFEFFDENGQPIAAAGGPASSRRSWRRPACRSSCSSFRRFRRTTAEPRRPRPLIAPRLRSLLLTLAAVSASALAFALYTRVVWPLRAARMGGLRAVARGARPRPLAARRARDRLALQRRLRARGLLLVRERDRGLHRDLAAGRLRAAGARGAADAAAARGLRAVRRSRAGRRGARAVARARGALLYVGSRVGLAQAARRHHRPWAARVAADPAGGRPGGRARPHARAAAGERVRARDGPGARERRLAAQPSRAGARARRERRRDRARAHGIRRLPAGRAERGGRARRCSRPASCRPTSAATESWPASGAPTTPRARSSTRTSSSPSRRSRRPPSICSSGPRRCTRRRSARPKTEEGAALDREIAGFVAGSRVPLVFGAYDVDAQGEFNAAVFLEPARDGRFEFETYRKAWLFPLTERVPRLLDRERVRALASLARHLAAGRGSAGDVAPAPGWSSAARGAADLLRRRHARSRDRRRPRRRRADRDALERRLVRHRRRAAPASGGVRVPEPRDAPLRRCARPTRESRRSSRRPASCSRWRACTSARRSSRACRRGVAPGR